MLKIVRRNRIPRAVLQTSLAHLGRASAQLTPVGAGPTLYALSVRGAVSAGRTLRDRGTPFLSGPFRPEEVIKQYPFLAQDIRQNASGESVYVVVSLELDGQNHCSLVGCPPGPRPLGRAGLSGAA